MRTGTIFAYKIEVMGKLRNLLLAVLFVAVCSNVEAKSGKFRKDVYSTRVDEALEYYIQNNYFEKTGLVYTCRPENVRSSKDCVNGMFHWYKGIPGGYGEGMGDCALIMGTALAGTVDSWNILTDRKARRKVKAQANLLANGMMNLASLHGIKGFVARGICADDGKSICSISSIDQYTHWLHSLWRWSRSGMAEPELLERYKVLVTEVAQFMEAKVIPENGYNFGLADGTIPDPRGICTMWGEKRAHAATRFPMVFATAYLATGETHWKDLYEKYIDRGLDMTLPLIGMTEKEVLSYMPCYSLYQAICSLEVVASMENGPERVEKIKRCINEFSRRANERATNADPAKPPYGMCWDGELSLTELMDPDYVMTDFNVRMLKDSVLEKEADKMGWCKAAHMYAAYWRYLARTLNK